MKNILFTNRQKADIIIQAIRLWQVNGNQNVLVKRIFLKSGKNVKISKGSITIKSEDGKTSGVVKNITSLYDLQANKQMDYYKKIKQAGLHGKISIKDCIIEDGTMYVFRNIKSKLFHEKYGFISEEEKQKAEETETIYNAIRTAGIDVIECVYV